MGVSTGQWQAAIGCWVGAREAAMSSSAGETDSSGPPSFFALVLAVLLIVAGVEPNPGPVGDKKQCEFCGTMFKTMTEDIDNKDKELSEREITLGGLKKQLEDSKKQVNLQEKLLEARVKLFDEREKVLAEREKLVAKNENLFRESDSYFKWKERQTEEGAPTVGVPADGVPAAEVPADGAPAAGAPVEGAPVDGVPASKPVDPPLTLEEQLLKAICAGNLLDVRAILRSGKISVENKYIDRKTPLLLAAENGHLFIVRYLLKEAGACKKARDNVEGLSALHWAARNGHLQVVEYLVKEAKLSVSLANANKETPLHISAHWGHLDIVRYIKEEGEADVDAKDNDGKTALHWAAAAGQLHIVIYLVTKAGADKNSIAANGNTPLHLACEQNYLDVVIFLVEAGIDKTKANAAGQTALQVTGSETIKKFLT